MERGLVNGLSAYAGLFVLACVAATLRFPHDLASSLPWIIAGVFVAVTIVFIRNLQRTPKRLAFAALRTVAHLLFDRAAPPAGFLMAILAAPHGMNALPKLGPILVGLYASIGLGLVLIRWVVVPHRDAG